MNQPTRGKRKVSSRTATRKPKVRRKHPEYGTSKLEDRFAKEFLDKLGVKYTRQYKADDIGRYYDFFIIIEGKSGILIEIDGDYFHSFGLVHEEKNRMQKHNEYVDKVKDEWAIKHKIPLLRIWEHDINDNPGIVLKELKQIVQKYQGKVDLENNKKKRH